MMKRQFSYKKQRPRKSAKQAGYRRATLLNSRDLSALEDHPARMLLLKRLAAKAGKDAAAEAIAAGVDRVYEKNGIIVRISPTGIVTPLNTLLIADPTGPKQFFTKYKPGTVLHVRRKK